MFEHSKRWILLGAAIVAAVAAVGSGIASTVGSSHDSPQPIPGSMQIADLPVVTPTAEERKIAEGLGVTEASLASAREVFESPEAGRMVFIPRSHGGCLIMFGGTSCGDPNDPTLPVLSLMTAIESSPYLVGGGITRSDVVAVRFKDSAGHETRLPAAGGVFKVETSDRLTRDAKYVGTESN